MEVLLPLPFYDTFIRVDTVQFEWDEDKNRENQRKHGIPFALAQYAFGDPDRSLYLSKEKDPDYRCRVLAEGKGTL
jgi:uncharacterized DUF497 family protein